jgi:hypothetical protein
MLHIIHACKYGSRMQISEFTHANMVHIIVRVRVCVCVCVRVCACGKGTPPDPHGQQIHKLVLEGCFEMEASQ